MTLHLGRARLLLRCKKRLACSAFIFWSVVAPSGAPVFAQRNVGFVLDTHGKWTDGSGLGFLKLGQLLPAEAVLTNTAPVDDDRIVVANLHGDIIKTIRCKDGVCRECTESGSCYDPIHPLPKTGDSAGAVSTVLSAVLDLFVEKPERYSVHRVRGTDPEVLKSEVVQLDANAVDFGSLLEGKEKGRYDVQVVPISEQANRAKKSFEGEIDWNHGEKALLAMHGLVPGLYEVFLYRGSSTATAWILLCTRADYRHAVDSFEEFVSQTESWGSSVTATTKQAYRRAFLEYLDLHISGSSL